MTDLTKNVYPILDPTNTSKEQVDMATCKKDPNQPVELSLLDAKTDTLRTTEDKRLTNSTSCSASRIWMVAAIGFGVIAAALAIYIIYDSSLSETTTYEKDVIKRYPGYFRTGEQQVAFERQVKKAEETKTFRKNVTVSNTTSPSDKCDYQCQCFGPSRKRRDIQEIYRKKRQSQNAEFHGCCISTSQFISPATLFTVNFEQRTLVHFTNNRQYFLVDKCSHAQGCTGCTCQQDMTVVTAVVENPNTDISDGENTNNPNEISNDPILDLVVVPGCCKCFNN